MEEGRVSPLRGVVYFDIVLSYRKIKNHALNIAETTGGEIQTWSAFAGRLLAPGSSHIC